MSGKRTPKRSSLGPTSGFVTLQVDVVADHDESALLVPEVDASSGVGEDDGADAHASEDANRERHFLRRISFIKMHAALHGRDGDIACVCQSPSFRRGRSRSIAGRRGSRHREREWRR